MQTVLKDYWGRENQNAYLEYDTSNLNCSFRSANKYLFKNGQNGYVGGAGEFQLVFNKTKYFILFSTQKFITWFYRFRFFFCIKH